MSATKVSSKVSKSATASKGKEAAKEEVKLVAVPSTVTAYVGTCANAEYSSAVAATSRDQSIVGLGTLLRKEMGKNPRAVTKASVAPLFAKAYREANAKLNTLPGYSTAKPHPKFKDEQALGLYIGQQLSRAIGIAYPGGAKATPAQAKDATENLTRYLATPDANQVTAFKVAAGSLAFKKDKLVEVKTSARGGANKKTGIELIRGHVKTLMEACKASKVSWEQMFIAISDKGVDMDVWKDNDEMIELASA